MRLRLLDLDGALDQQAAIRQALTDGVMMRIEARDLASRLRIVASRTAFDALSQRLHSAFSGGQGPLITFYGSGDFHHVTTALIGLCEGPLTVLHFDNHPDWVKFPKTHNCGAWVNRALELEHVMRVVTLGPTSDDLVRPQWQMANLRALETGHMALFPFRHAPSRVFGTFAPSPSYDFHDGALHWTCLEERSVEAILALIMPLIATEKVYITFDKDVLQAREAATNWDQGLMPLATVCAVIKAVAQRYEIVGLDICGDWSQPVFADPFRWFLSACDRSVAAPDEDALACNAQTNAQLLSLIEDLFAA
jgi:hypothetical protein